VRIQPGRAALCAMTSFLVCMHANGERVKAPNGDDLVRQCELVVAIANAPREVSPGLEQRDFDQAVGYFTGILEANSYYVENVRSAPAAFCAPPGARILELSEAALKYLRANPGKLKMLKTPLLFAALHESWPCPAKS